MTAHRDGPGRGRQRSAPVARPRRAAARRRRPAGREGRRGPSGRRALADGRHRLPQALAGGEAFVEIGSKVQAGDKVLLVEAMKTFNEIVAPRAGTVTAIFVEDGTPVEYGEPLLVIE